MIYYYDVVKGGMVKQNINTGEKTFLFDKKVGFLIINANDIYINVYSIDEYGMDSTKAYIVPVNGKDIMFSEMVEKNLYELWDCIT